ncbi:hypothetical protein EDM56_06820 [Brevibacillus fluminis]|uniref:Uncharacterized protein n=1 Tax=Brevibacillus fluminis TaxID=511487 RepID=A0A3M8DT56_9BACL|nr:hypothetical protein [Brevibacillus fluminis]RNB91286.1 hypothetical protein EDM56_06820 [Brevibacillus fluminis]
MQKPKPSDEIPIKRAGNRPTRDAMLEGGAVKQTMDSMWDTAGSMPSQAGHMPRYSNGIPYPMGQELHQFSGRPIHANQMPHRSSATPHPFSQMPYQSGVMPGQSGRLAPTPRSVPRQTNQAYQKPSRMLPPRGFLPVSMPPTKPYPADPYIEQLPLAEALRKGTLFRWMHDPYADPYRG